MPPSPPAPASPGQRRHLAVLFADLSGSTAISRRLEAEDFALLLSRFRALCRQVLGEHGGQVARLQGDGLLAVFGYPDAAEDAPWRAIQAAVALCNATPALDLSDLPPLGQPLQVHCGVHAGRVLVAGGDLELGRFDLIGDMPNAAAKLSARAAPGQVLASRDAIGPFEAHFGLGADVTVALDDSGDVLRAAVVQHVQAPQRHFDARVRRGQARFVGRDAELARLLAFASPQPHGAAGPAVATVCAGPGLGKSRLLEELSQHLADGPVRVLRGYCEAYLGAEVLQPLLHLARDLLGLGLSPVAADTDALRARLSALVDDGTTQAVLAALRLSPRDATTGPAPEALAALLAAQARLQPLLLVLDDWQWADDASLQALRALLAADPPLRVVLASRESEVALWSRGDAPQLALQPLSLDDIALTTRDLLPGADPLLVRELHQLAGGVPLYVEELCHAAGAGQGLGIVRDAPQGSAWLNLLVEARLTRLGDGLVEFISLGAVVGTTVPLALMAQLMPAVDCEALAEAAERADFLLRLGAPGSGTPQLLAFKHVLTRDAVYGRLSPAERRRTHRRVYDALLAQSADTEGALEALAWHSAGAGLRAEGAALAERAGDRALASNAFDVARRLYAGAMQAYEDWPDAGPEQWQHGCRVAGKLGMACVFDPLALSDGVGLFERALAAAERLQREPELARTRYWLGYICYAKGLVRQGLRHGRLAVAQADALGDRRLAAQARATLGQTLLAAGDYAQALPLLDVALDHKRAGARPGSGVAVGSAYTLACAGCLLGDQGRFDEAAPRFTEALALLGDSGHPVGSSVRGWISAVHLWQGNWQAALEIALQGERIAEQARVRQLLAMSRALAGYARWRLGGGASARQQVAEATHWIQARQGGFFTSLNHGWLVDMAAAAGDTAAARRHAVALLARAREGDQLGLAMGARALARLAAAQGDPGRAQRHLRLARRAARHRGSAHEDALNRWCEAELLAAAGQAGAAQALHGSARASLQALDMAGHLQALSGT